MATRLEGKIAPQVSAEYAAWIGRIAIEWSKFEYILDVWLGLLTGSELDAGRCVTAQIAGPGRRLDALLALAKLHQADEALVKKLNGIAGTTYLLGEKRNRAIHDPWIASAESDTHWRLEVTAKKKLVFEHKVVPMAELEKLANDIIDHTKKFRALEDDLGRLPGRLEMLRGVSEISCEGFHTAS